ncbi:MAG: CRISPR-associated helicase Cas3' [Pirellulales bacterium]
MKRLLAKKYDREKHGDSPPDYALLTQHTFDVVAACGAIADAAGYTTLCNLGLDEGTFEEFQLLLRANGWIQDLGKANSHFQVMVTAQPQLTQLLRHEVISGLLVWHDSRFRAWLTNFSYPITAAVWGAMGHHRKFDEQTAPKQVSNAEIYVNHHDFSEILTTMGKDLGVTAVPPTFAKALALGRPSGGLCDLRLPANLDDLIDEFEDLETDFETVNSRRLLASVKAFGVAADVVASAVAFARYNSQTESSVGDYVRESLVEIGLTTADLTSLIHKWAWDHIECDSVPRDESMLPPGFEVRAFQCQVAESKSCVTLARAGCGSGKSLAAYLWARNWCETSLDSGRSNFRLFFCLPTTGTATEHFKEYALESGIDSSLTHSRSTIDLRTIAETSPQEEKDEENSAAAEAACSLLNAERDKIESLNLWSTPLVVATADAILGLMVNARRAIYSFPAIMCGALVFDEVHAFDDQMFGHLLAFVKNFPRLPILLMTASLPEQRRRAIMAVRPDLCIVPGPKEFEELERYELINESGEEEIWRAVEECLADNGKVLWVRNQVEWANRTYLQCRSRFSDTVTNVYHSRLRYKDRSRRHRQVIDCFKRSNNALILVATQVAEMSLDLSADLLITDIAAIPALIQRMGRLNRRSTPDKPIPPKPAMIRSLPESEWAAEKPYHRSDIDAAELWLRYLKGLGHPLSQRDLSDAFARFCNDGEFDIAGAEERAWFFGVAGKSGLWRTRPGMTREEGYTVPVILKTDLEQCDERNRYGEPTSDWLRKHEVSIPFRESVLKWESVGTVRIAPPDFIEYDYDEATGEGTGAKWKSR